MTKPLGILMCVLALGMLPFLGGSMIWHMSGANRLNIDGVALPVARDASPKTLGKGWPAYGGDTGGHRYSQASQLNPENVGSLETAWVFRTGDMGNRPGSMRESASQATPILVDDLLVFCTPFNEVIALDPGSGAERWRFDPEINLQQNPANQYVCRGVSHWRDSARGGECSSRIFMGTNDARLIAIDARSGERCAGFGENGEVRIEPGMELWWPGEFQITSPPLVVADTVVVGSAIGDNARVVAPAGAVRAFDVRSGAMKWVFDPIPRTPSAAGRSTWQGGDPPKEGHTNVWAPMSADIERRLVFLPTSSPSPDFYGGLRPGDNRFANSIVALHVDSGELAWGFQTVHHDVWDYDLPAQPGLYTVWKDGAAHDVVAQVTKTGMVFVLDRETGKPFLPVEERAVPQAAIAGESLSPTQPFTLSPPIVPQATSAEEAFGITWFDRRACRQRIAESRSQGIFTPPSEQGTLLVPFTGGGANWGSSAFDPSRNLLVVNMSNMAHKITLFPADQVEEVRKVFHDQEVSPQKGAPYGMKREVLLSPLGLPCNAPPWGIIAGIDLATGAIIWRKALGTTRDLSPGPAFTLGTPNVGGPAISAGGLVFIGAAMDDYLRALDVATGEELWKGRLPAGGQATPMMYEWEGRQFVVIFAGGNARMGTRLGDSLVAFALPERQP